MVPIVVLQKFIKMSISIYQVLPRLFDNRSSERIRYGSVTTNGVGKLNAFTPKALSEIKGLGVTHIWYTGVIEHATQTQYSEYNLDADHYAVVKGKAGSPYAIKDYYDIDPDLATNIEERMEEFEQLVQRTHEAGLKAIIDFVPNHLAREYHSDAKPKLVTDFGEQDDTNKAFDPQNNFYYLPSQTLHLQFGHKREAYPYTEFPAKVTGNDCFHANPTKDDWYETIKLNYGVDYLNGGEKHFSPIPDTWNKMLDVLLFWAEKGVDGFRCDMAEMVPLEFWTWAIEKVKAEHPAIIFIAEIYNPDVYNAFLEVGGFDYLYDKVGLYDHLVGVLKGERSTKDIQPLISTQHYLAGKLLRFMENHDEQRLASNFISSDGHKAFPAMVVSTLIDSSAVMTYFGQELGEPGMDNEGFSGVDGRTSIFDYWSLPLLQQWIDDGSYSGSTLPENAKQLRRKYQQLLNAKLNNKMLWEGHYYDLGYINEHWDLPQGSYSVFLRGVGDRVAIVLCNFSNRSATVPVVINEHAFLHMDMSTESVWRADEIFSETTTTLELRPDRSIEVKLTAFESKVFILNKLNNEG